MAHPRRVVPILTLALAAASLVLIATPGLAGTVVSCPISAHAGDNVDRGIVVPNYPGTNVRLVYLRYEATFNGLYSITMEIHRGSFDGPIVGTSSINLVIPSGFLPDGYNGLFQFGGPDDGAPVSPGDTLAIIQTYSGPGFLFFDVGTGALGGGGGTSCGGVYETESTAPPLDTLRRNTVGIDIIQFDLSTACIPSDTVLCISDSANPGDRRFKLTMDFSHAGGASGSGQAITGIGSAPTGGGAFWFFNQSNPEVLVKVLNGCSINHKFWVLFSAGTNVGFTVHVEDTQASLTNTYTNADNVAALPVQDTSSFPCP